MNKTFKAAIIEVKGGNVRNSHINLRGTFGMFPLDCIGGKNRSVAGKAIEVHIGKHIAKTDVDGTKAIFRERGSIGKFLRDVGISEGDHVLVERVAPRVFRVSKISSISLASYL